MPDDTRRGANIGGALIGLAIMLFGVALLLDQAGVVDGWDYVSFWPAVVITIGLVKLSHRRDDGRREGGWWLFFGVWMLLSEMRVLRFRDWWPLMLVAIGISMVWKEVVPGLLRHERVE